MRRSGRVSRAASAAAAALAGLLCVSLLCACGGRVDGDRALASLPAAEQRLVSGSAPIPAAADHATPPGFVASSDGPAVEPRHAAAGARGVLLSGMPGVSAYAALTSHLEASPVVAAVEGRLAAPRLKAVIRRTSTVGQVNAALTAAGARIVSMQPGNSELVLELSGVPGASTIDETAQRLFATQAFDSVVRPDGLPIASNLAVAGHAAVESPGDPLLPETVDDHQPPP